MTIPVRAILCDIDGTLVFQGRAISGAAQAVSDLRSAGIILQFLTNISSLPPESIAGQLSDHGFDIRPDEIETSVTACASLLAGDAKSVWLLVPDTVRHLFDRCRKEAENPDVVVVTDVMRALSYAAMNEAYLKLDKGRPVRRSPSQHVLVQGYGEMPGCRRLHCRPRGRHQPNGGRDRQAEHRILQRSAAEGRLPRQ